MKKEIILLVVLIVISIGILCGCTEDETSNEDKTEYPDEDITGDTNKAELLDYKIETWKIGDNLEDDEKIGDGFIHSEEADYYLITGTIKNIAGEMLNTVKITASFYDDAGKYLDYQSAITTRLANTYTWNFEMIYNYYVGYFYDIEDVIFEITTT
jgi:hypothetical protein